MTNKPKAIGTAAETAVCRALIALGATDCLRVVLHGNADQGDLHFTSGQGHRIAVEVKGGRAAETASSGLVSDWLDEAETERHHAGRDVAIVVTKRAGYGPANAASWWAYARCWPHADGLKPHKYGDVTIRTTVTAMVRFLDSIEVLPT